MLLMHLVLFSFILVIYIMSIIFICNKIVYENQLILRYIINKFFKHNTYRSDIILININNMHLESIILN